MHPHEPHEPRQPRQPHEDAFTLSEHDEEMEQFLSVLRSTQTRTASRPRPSPGVTVVAGFIAAAGVVLATLVSAAIVVVLVRLSIEGIAWGVAPL